MNKWFIYFMLASSGVCAAGNDTLSTIPKFSIGTRNTISMFSDDAATGVGVGGQFRYRLFDRLNTEWFADFIPSHTQYINRNDYHIGWSLMYYFTRYIHFDHVLQPYLLAGHCFDMTVVSERNNSSNSASRFTGATQAGIGTHLNMNKRFDCSLSAQYMLHFGRDIETEVNEGKVEFHRSNEVNPDGHLLITLSFNYKI